MILQEFVFRWEKKTDHENLPSIPVPLYSWNDFFFFCDNNNPHGPISLLKY